MDDGRVNEPKPEDELVVFEEEVVLSDYHIAEIKAQIESEKKANDFLMSHVQSGPPRGKVQLIFNPVSDDNWIDPFLEPWALRYFPEGI